MNWIQGLGDERSVQSRLFTEGGNRTREGEQAAQGHPVNLGPVWPRAQAGHRVPLPSCIACSSSPLGFVSPSEWAQNRPSFLPAALPAVCHVGSRLHPSRPCCCCCCCGGGGGISRDQPAESLPRTARAAGAGAGLADSARQEGASQPAEGGNKGRASPPAFPVLLHPHQPREGVRSLGWGARGLEGPCVSFRELGLSGGEHAYFCTQRRACGGDL